MIEQILWGISFVTVFLAFVWIQVLYLDVIPRKKEAKELPSIDVAIPAYNEEDGIEQTIRSIEEMDYPKDRVRILVVDNASTDRTQDKVRELQKIFPNIILLKQPKQGKACAMNMALSHADAEIFACVDADSYITKKAVKQMLPHLEEGNVGAVISAIKVSEPKTIIEKVQRIEYIMAVLSRKLRASINTLAMTPGVLSIYRTKIVKKIGGFDEDNITEDFEIAMRLKYHGYNMRIEPNAFTFTKVPNTLAKLFRQRIRWYRGYLYNHWKYRSMFFNKKYGIMGYFQLPINMLGVPILLATLAIISFGVIQNGLEFIVRGLFIEGYLSSLIQFPSLKQWFLAQNLRVMFPIWIGAMAGAYMFIIAHKQVRERIFLPVSIWVYFACLPMLVGYYWISAVTQEIFGMKRRW